MVRFEGDTGWFPVLALVSSVLPWPELCVKENWKVFGEVNVRVVSAFEANENIFGLFISRGSFTHGHTHLDCRATTHNGETVFGDLLHTGQAC